MGYAGGCGLERKAVLTQSLFPIGVDLVIAIQKPRPMAHGGSPHVPADIIVKHLAAGEAFQDESAIVVMRVRLPDVLDLDPAAAFRTLTGGTRKFRRHFAPHQADFIGNVRGAAPVPCHAASAAVRGKLEAVESERQLNCMPPFDVMAGLCPGHPRGAAASNS